MPRARSNGIEIEYEVFGDAGAVPVLLVMGLGGQMILWDDDFCRMLAERGLRAIRYDNRDVGRSTIFEAAGMPDVMTALMSALSGGTPEAPYTLSDMAADAAGLLDALEMESAHVVGISMGGMIAQTLALEHASRVRTLTSIMSSTGDASLPQPRPEAMGAMLSPAPEDRAGNIERAVTLFRAIGSPGFPFDEERVRRIAAESYDRGFHPAGVARQLVAILASGDRTARLGAVGAPTLVVHGKGDPLVPVECGMATASAIPGARLELVEGMGHDMPREIWGRLVDLIADQAARG